MLCLAGFPLTPDKMFLGGASFLAAIFVFILLRKLNPSPKSKIVLIYAHLLFLFFPAVLLTTNAACGTFCLPCGDTLISLTLLALPTTALLSAFAGLFLMPAFFMINSSHASVPYINNFVSRISKSLGMSVPRIYLVDTAKPTAFSFRSLGSAMFLSVGLLDILEKKEVESVVLHEMDHIKRGSSVLKFSGFLMRIFSPLSTLFGFNSDIGRDERRADRFACRIQGTSKYLKSAKRKIELWEAKR